MATTQFNSNNYVITSGWWCGEVKDEIRKRLGSEKIREVSFFQQWKDSIYKHSNPKKIMILDSASPVVPDKEDLQGRPHF